MVGMFQVERAGRADCEALAATAKAAFTDDELHRQAVAPLPAGYDSPRWYALALGWAHLFRFMVRQEVVGGAVVINEAKGHLEIGRIWLAPRWQGLGYGREALHALESAAPPGTRFHIDVPACDERTLHFCPRCGYQEVARSALAVYFEKQVSPKNNRRQAVERPRGLPNESMRDVR